MHNFFFSKMLFNELYIQLIIERLILSPDLLYNIYKNVGKSKTVDLEKI